MVSVLPALVDVFGSREKNTEMPGRPFVVPPSVLHYDPAHPGTLAHECAPSVRSANERLVNAHAGASVGAVTRIPLTRDATSWIHVQQLPPYLSAYGRRQFMDLWNLHPGERGKVMHSDTEAPSHRWHKAYLRTPKRDQTLAAAERKSFYMFSGRDESCINDPLPEPLVPLVAFANATTPTTTMSTSTPSSETVYNQVVANWYEGNDDYIAAHSDCTLGMASNASIMVMNFTESDEGATREFILKPKRKSTGGRELYDRVCILLRHGCVITMGGATQAEFRHGVPRVPRAFSGPRCSPGPRDSTRKSNLGNGKNVTDDISRRISVTMRQYPATEKLSSTPLRIDDN